MPPSPRHPEPVEGPGREGLPKKSPVETSTWMGEGANNESPFRLIPSHDEPVGGGPGRGSNSDSPFCQRPPPQTPLEAAWRSAREAAGSALSWAKSAWAAVRLAIDQVFSSSAGK